MKFNQKQTLAVLLVLAMCFAAAPMALAMTGSSHGSGMGSGMGSGGGPGSGGGMGGNGGPGMGNPTHFSARGTVIVPPTTDPAATATITVNVKYANRALANFIGQDVEFTISDNVVVMVAGVGRGGLDDILQDDIVKVMGNVVDNGDGTKTYEITRIMVF